MGKIRPLGRAELPAPLPLRKLLGPSFILLGLGLGSGELILWPYLATNFGLGIIWGALLGITMQFFLNMEIERYALVNGESVFVGLARKYGLFAPIWFIFSTLTPWIWPGIIASSGLVLQSVFNLPDSPAWSIGLLLLAGVTLSLGPVLYKTQERLQKTLLVVGVPFIFLLAIFLAGSTDWQHLAWGLVGRGQNYWWLPPGIPLAVLLGALAYSGAGGNLNLAQSFYVKEKGYGMGKYAGRITSLLTGQREKIALEGRTFKLTPENLNRFKKWWRMINAEHLVVFWLTGLVTMLLLSLLANALMTNLPLKLSGINFILAEAAQIGQRTLPLLGSIFLLIAGLMLFSTQFSVLDATSRIMAENISILNKKKFPVQNLPKHFYFFLWAQIFIGAIILLFKFNEPLTLVVIGAVLNALTMFIYSGLILRLNLTSLPKVLRPSAGRVAALVFTFVFFGVFSLLTLKQNL